jgi:hypothetical protein
VNRARSNNIDDSHIVAAEFVMLVEIIQNDAGESEYYGI